MSNDYKNIGAIILAAGKGKRMNISGQNKVTVLLRDKPVIKRIVEMFESLSLGEIVVVIGHEKGSVQKTLQGHNVVFAEQAEQLGTAHAAEIGLQQVFLHIEHVFIIYGDDASLYSKSFLTDVIQTHFSQLADVTFVTFTVHDPTGLGRVVRDSTGNVSAIIEERNASEEQKKIVEVNSGLYLVNRSFLQEYLPKIDKNPISGEYYLTDIIQLALDNHKKVTTFAAGNLPWKGINTLEELKEAEQMFAN